jgi:hypothetical protein
MPPDDAEPARDDLVVILIDLDDGRLPPIRAIRAALAPEGEWVRARRASVPVSIIEGWERVQAQWLAIERDYLALETLLRLADSGSANWTPKT